MSARLPARLDFLGARPFDLLASVKLSGDNRQARRIEIIYAEHGVLSSFERRLHEAPSAGERAKMVRAAAKALLAEIKSRMLAGQEFYVWFFDAGSQEFLEQEAAQLASDEPIWRRAYDKLLLVGRIVSASAG